MTQAGTAAVRDFLLGQVEKGQATKEQSPEHDTFGKTRLQAKAQALRQDCEQFCHLPGVPGIEMTYTVAHDNPVECPHAALPAALPFLP